MSSLLYSLEFVSLTDKVVSSSFSFPVHGIKLGTIKIFFREGGFLVSGKGVLIHRERQTEILSFLFLFSALLCFLLSTLLYLSATRRFPLWGIC